MTNIPPRIRVFYKKKYVLIGHGPKKTSEIIARNWKRKFPSDNIRVVLIDANKRIYAVYIRNGKK